MVQGAAYRNRVEETQHLRHQQGVEYEPGG